LARTIATLPTSTIKFDSSDGSPADCLQGVMELGGVPFHVIAVRVVERSNIQGVPTRASDMARDWYDTIQAMDPGFKHTVRIPQMQGDWVIVVTPYTE